MPTVLSSLFRSASLGTDSSAASLFQKAPTEELHCGRTSVVGMAEQPALAGLGGRRQRRRRRQQSAQSGGADGPERPPHLPFHSGLRFWAKAMTPSIMSSERKRSPTRGYDLLIACSSGSPRLEQAACFVARTEVGRAFEDLRRPALRRAGSSASRHDLVDQPERCASAAEIAGR